VVEAAQAVQDFAQPLRAQEFSTLVAGVAGVTQINPLLLEEKAAQVEVLMVVLELSHLTLRLLPQILEAEVVEMVFLVTLPVVAMQGLASSSFVTHKLILRQQW
jgi:hypothetical protein